MPKLERFKKESNKPTIKHMLYATGIIVGLLAVFVVYKSFALYTREESHDIIKAKVSDYRKAEYVSYDNTKTNLDCTEGNATVKCALDKLVEMVGN